MVFSPAASLKVLIFRERNKLFTLTGALLRELSFFRLRSKTATTYYNRWWCEMQTVTKSMAAIAMLLSLCFATSSTAQVKSKPAGTQVKAATIQHVDDEALRLNAEVIRTTTEYRDKLAILLELDQREVARLTKEVESREPLLEEGYISRKELEESKLTLARERAKIAETRQRIDEAENVIGEAEARAQLLTLPPLPTGGYSESGTLMRYNGKAPWSLADSGKIENFFSSRFGYSLPVSARGETDLHWRMHFDHSNAMDVALNPDSVEGHALMDYLRGAGIPFLAFRGRVAGKSTGAHIHIGKPSLKLASP
jgi:hypothetical protein